MQNPILFLILVVAMLSISACSALPREDATIAVDTVAATPTVIAQQEAENLIGTHWTLFIMEGENVSQKIDLTLDINSDGISGETNCNIWRNHGKYHFQDGVFRMEFIATTTELCGNTNTLERKFVELIPTAVRYVQNGDSLTFFDADEKELLVFKQDL